MNETDTNFQRFCSQCGGLVDADARFCKHCAFDLTRAARHSDEKVVTAKSQQRSNSKTTLAIIGVAIVGLLILGLVAIYLHKRNSTQSDVAATTPTPVPNPTMSDRAKQVEDKILRGETLSDGDIAGLSAYELCVAKRAFCSIRAQIR